MGKERELLESMKASLEQTATLGSSAASGSATSSGSGNVGSDFQSVIDFTVAIAMSVASDPVFYLKIVGVLALTILIIMISIELVSGG